MITDFDNPLLFLTLKKVEGVSLTDVQGHHFIDFSTQCYLALDKDKEIARAQIEGINEYGNVVPWSRTVATLEIFERAECALAEFVGFEATNIFTSTTLLNHGVIPVLAGFEGALIAFEKDSYPSSFEGALLAESKGAEIKKWKNHHDLEKLLREPYKWKLVITDGVHSMSGTFANLPKLQELCIQYQAYLYIDDAHGFGVVGQNPSPEHPLGHKGNGLLNYYGLTRERIFYVGCLSKAFGLPGAFIACNHSDREYFLSHASPHDLSLAGQASSIFGTLKALEINEKKGNEIRTGLIDKTKMLKDNLQRLGYTLYQNSTCFPIVTLAFENHEFFLQACYVFFENGILPTTEPFHKDGHGVIHLFRFTITKEISFEDINKVIQVCEKLKRL